jgi:hypothetical protein
MRQHLLIAVACLCLAAASARANDLFVDNVRGDDTGSGKAQIPSADLGGPLRSLTRALELARSGDRIVMTDTGVPYRESVTLMGGRHNGLGRQAFVIEGNGAILDGSDLVPTKSWEHFRDDIYRFRPPHVAFAQLFLDGPPVERRPIDNSLGRLPMLAPQQWCLADGWIYFRTEERQFPADYPLTYAALTVGVTLYEVRDVIIRNLTVQGFQLDGINAHDCAKDCQLVGVIARGNGRAGIAVGGASSVRLRSCLLNDNGDAQILTDGPSTTSIEETEVESASAPALLHRGGNVFYDGRRLSGPSYEALPPGESQ